MLAVRREIPAFKAAVATVLAAAGAPGTAASYRELTKSLYRMIEKALTKGPRKAEGEADFSQILDVFGCLVVCPTYPEMAAVLGALIAQHKSGDLRVCRIKDRWTHPSSGGWRDLMLNVVVNGVVFEVQIVLQAMLTARKGLDAHKAYNHCLLYTSPSPRD